MVILSKGCKPNNFEQHNSLKPNFTNIWGLPFNLCWMWIFLWVKFSWHSYSMWDKLGWHKWFSQFLNEWLSSFNLKGFYYSYTWSCSLCGRRNSFFTGLISRKLCGFLLMFSTDFTSLGLFFLYRSCYSSLCIVFYSNSSNIQEVFKFLGTLMSIIRTG